ncbi:hydantoinase subunit beta [Clostridiales bacterium PH28_bin88]|nr:hydantoinase subunit beta [Clostridiales bacterium PH28_bin88]
MNYRLGIDVGGTNTDAVIIDEKLNLVAKVKTPTTEDVTTGIYTALQKVLEKSGISKDDISYAMLGTTHCTNAIVERKRLCRVGIIRIGKPATMAIAPMVDWPPDLVKVVGEKFFIVRGGHEFDGKEIACLNPDELRSAARGLKGQVDAVAITSVFSPISADHEKRAAEILREELGELPFSLSHEIASIGLLERENATILNAALAEVAKTTALGFKTSLEREGVTNARVYLCQNDGTLMSIDYALKYPILTVACGPTNSIRGASFVSGRHNAIVLDVGGTTSDIGVLVNGFPRESSVAVEIGGVRTNFRMPDLISIGLGGGTVVREVDGEIKVGPDSVGYRLTKEALVFGGNTLTATDIAVRLGLAEVGNPAKVGHVDIDFAKKVLMKIISMVNEAIDKMKLSSDPVPLILVGGGSILVTDEVEGVSEIIRPENYEVANALGAAIAQVSGQVERVFSLSEVGREEALKRAKEIAFEEAVKAGAEPSTVQIVEVEDVPLAYLPGNATRIRVKAAGDLKSV